MGSVTGDAMDFGAAHPGECRSMAGPRSHSEAQAVRDVILHGVETDRRAWM